MSNDATFRCPVCRARQELQRTCRRCQADLSLVERARRRVDHLITLRAQAILNQDARLECQIRNELKLLAPAEL